MLTPDGKVRFIDYDGLQIGNDKSFAISSMLGDQDQYDCPKYLKDGKYTKELDIRSLIMLYFITTFNVDLNYVGKLNPVTGKPITLEEIFRQIGLDDQDVMHKVWKSFQSTGENEYLGEDVNRISEKYKMTIYQHPTKYNTNIKILSKK